MKEHPIAPSTELLQKLADGPGTWLEKISKAYCAGADQELEASMVWLIANQNPRWAAALQEARRPKPPSLKEQALAALETQFAKEFMESDERDIIRRALEALPD